MDADTITFLEWSFRGSVLVLATICWWMWQQMVKAVTKNKDDLEAHRREVALNYAPRDSMERGFNNITQRLDSLMTILAGGDRKP